MEWTKHDNGTYSVEYMPGNATAYRLQMSPLACSDYPNQYILTWVDFYKMPTMLMCLNYDVHFETVAEKMGVRNADARPIADAYNALVKLVQVYKPAVSVTFQEVK